MIPVIALVACLAGAWTLRFLVLSAGLPQAVASPGMEQILQGGVTFIP